MRYLLYTTAAAAFKDKQLFYKMILELKQTSGQGQWSVRWQWRHLKWLLVMFYICEDSSHSVELLTRGCWESSFSIVVTAPSIFDIHTL